MARKDGSSPRLYEGDSRPTVALAGRQHREDRSRPSLMATSQWVNGSKKRLARFGVFELDLDARELRKQGVRLQLQPNPLQLLAILLERPGEIVTRDELRRRLWDDDTFVDHQSGLNTAANRLRLKLG